MLVNVFIEEFEKATSSCVVVCAAPHAPEKAVRRNTAVMIVDFRPNTSLSLDQMINVPEHVNSRSYS